MTNGVDFLSVAQAVLSLRSQRESLIVANITNADTPGYKARDIAFSADLQAALSGEHGSAKPLYQTDFPVSLNGNDVSLTAEKLESLRNEGAIEAEATFLHQSTTDLITALRPNPNGI